MYLAWAKLLKYYTCTLLVITTVLCIGAWQEWGTHV